MRLLLAFLFFFGSLSAWAQDIPQPMSPPRLLNDFVGALNATEQAQLEQKLRTYADSTSTQEIFPWVIFEILNDSSNRIPVDMNV